MAAFCTSSVIVGSIGESFSLTFPSNSRPQLSPSTCSRCCCCSTQVRSRWSPGNSLDSPRLAKETRAPRRRRSWGQQRMSASCSPTDVSFDAASAVVGDNESGMSIEEKNAILAFEEGRSVDETGEERNSSEGQPLSGEDGAEASEAMEKGKDVAGAERLPESAPVAVKGQGAAIANVCSLFMSLLGRHSGADGRMLAGAGSAVLERVEEEVGKLQEVEGVDGQSLFETLRVVKLLRMDLQLIAAARKESTMSERIVQTTVHCKQLLQIVSNL